MKRVIIASVMVSLILSSAIISNILINKKLNSLLKETNMIIELSDDMSENDFNNKLNQFLRQWNSTEKYLQLFEPHDKYEEIKIHFGLLEQKYKNNYKQEIIPDLIELKNLLINYIESRKINLQNIMVI